MQEDVATRTAVQLYSNQLIARDPEMRRQLASAIPKRSVLSWKAASDQRVCQKIQGSRVSKSKSQLHP
jgi:hypothetical protein